MSNGEAPHDSSLGSIGREGRSVLVEIEKLIGTQFKVKLRDLSDGGEVALFLPAMTLFEEAAKGFRSQFFQKMKVHTVANFSNMRWIISGGRFTAPAAALFYHARLLESELDSSDEMIRTYSPNRCRRIALLPPLRTATCTSSWPTTVNRLSRSRPPKPTFQRMVTRPLQRSSGSFPNGRFGF